MRSSSDGCKDHSLIVFMEPTTAPIMPSFPYRRFKPANVLSEGLAASNATLYSSFRSRFLAGG
jgi:hypothetical protein